MPQSSRGRRHTSSAARACFSAILAFIAACDNGDTLSTTFEPSPDAQLRQLLSQSGVASIGQVPQQDAVLAELGRSLFFDKILSGNRDVSCATCHQPSANLGDGLSLAVGTGANVAGDVRSPGPGRQFVPRNAPSLLNTGLGLFYVLWDGRVNDEGRFFGPPGGADGGSGVAVGGVPGVVFPPGLSNLIAAQAMLPVLNRVEMRGNAGDLDTFGNPNELAAIDDSAATEIWKAAMNRVLSIQEYADRFASAFPGVPSRSLGFQHAANAIAAFQIQELTRTSSPFDRYLARDDKALSDEEKRGALLFFGRAGCASCHSGALLGGQQFANIGVPQIGPGVGSAAPLDRGRGETFLTFSGYDFAFRVPMLRNVELTAPYMHNGAYRTLENVVRHYTNADSAHRAYDTSQLDAALRTTHHGDDSSMAAVLSNLDFRVANRIVLSETDQRELVAFLKSLTDPSARDLSAVVPARVPSGLPVQP